MEHLTLEQFKKYKKKINKYGNKKVVVDGMDFDSNLESERWKELRILEKANLIKDLRRQIKFELQPSYKKNDKTIQSIKYIADFMYYDLNKKQFVVEDTKGFKTDVYKLKKKIFEYKYPDIDFREIRKEEI